MTTPKQYYSHDAMLRDLNRMHRQMHLEGYTPDLVVGITRGGLVPSVYVSHYFEAPLKTVAVSFRDDDYQGDVTELHDALLAGKRVLVVDDICDSGATLEWIYEKLVSLGADMANYATMTLIHNAACQKYVPTYYGTEINKAEQDVWIVFDWEK